jgi:hypothetical protein
MSGNDYYVCLFCGKVGFQKYVCDCHKTEMETERDRLKKERNAYKRALQKISKMFKDYPPETDIEYMTTGIAIQALAKYDKAEVNDKEAK